MKLNKLILGATVALGFAAFGQTDEVQAAEWSARTVEEVQSDFLAEDTSNSTYTIQWGDTLGVIAKAADVKLNTLAEINDIKNADLIFPGNKLSFKTDEAGQVEEVTIEDISSATVETYSVEETSETPVVEKTNEQPTTEAPAVEEAPVVEAEPVVEAAPVQEVEPEPVVEAAAPVETTQTATAVPYYVYQVVESEAGPGQADIAGVASVIYNRTQSGNWGGTDAYSVVTAPGQFEVHANGMAAAATPTQETINIVNSVFGGSTTNGAESFRASGDGVTNYFF